MYLCPTSLDEIHRSIADLKIGKASGIAELSAEVLKISALAIVPYLQKLINQMFSQGEFTDCLKINKVIPLFKSGSKPDVDNYGSFSLQPVLSKVLKKIMCNHDFEKLLIPILITDYWKNCHNAVSGEL